MDPLRLTISFAPLAVYVLLLGALHLRRQPTVFNGTRDGLLLGLALSGFVLVGPLELLLPESTAFRFGGYAWMMLVSFYLLSLVLAIMVGRPRIVIYNVDAATLRPALSIAVRKLDEHARWAGDCVILPTVGVQFYLERYGTLRNVQLRAIGSDQPYSAWLRLEKLLRSELRQASGDRGALGTLLVLTAIAILTLVTMTCLREQAEMVRSFQEMLRR